MEMLKRAKNRVADWLIGLVIVAAVACVIAPAYSGPIIMEPSYSAGTAALPSLKWIGDEDTGLWSPAANTLAISTGGVEAIRWNSSQQTLISNGTAAAPALAFSSQPALGWWRAGNNELFIGQGGSTITRFGVNTSNGILLSSGSWLQWSNASSLVTGSATDLTIARDLANILAQRNGTAAQTLRVYNTFTDASNGEWVEANWASATNVALLRMTANGTGSLRTLRLAYGGTTNSAISVPIATTSPVDLANVGLTSVASSGRVRISNLNTVTATSGTHRTLFLNESLSPTASSTMVAYGLAIEPTINYAAGGAGSYEIERIAVTETALPSGKNYLARWLAGSAGTQDIFAVTNTTHIETGQSTAPALSSCGTGPSIVGTDANGKVTVGTGVTTSCTSTFATAYTNAPACTVSGDNTAVTYIATTSTTVLTITSSADMASDVIGYICMGRV